MIIYLLIGLLFAFLIETTLKYGPTEEHLEWNERLVTVLLWPILFLFLILELLRK